MRPWTERHGHTTPRGARRASMGPRPCGRGRHWTHGSQVWAMSFNGATALRPWTAPCPRRPLIPLQASMGPRPCGRGRVFCGTYTTRAAPRFNGATALRPWTAMRPTMLSGAVYSFNGATALRPWTDARAPEHLHVEQLQWGHGLAAVDGQFHGGAFAQALKLQWGHGLAAVDGSPPTSCSTRSPGLQWGHGLAAVDGVPARVKRRRQGKASMGPRPCGRGRPMRSIWSTMRALLQWGHGLAAVDGRAPNRTPVEFLGFNGATALRPWTG